MKAQTLAARIAAKLTTKDGAIAKKFQDVEKVLLGYRYHGRSYSGSGRYVHTIDGKHYSTIEGLTLIGVDFTTGNDAKFGGKSGDYVQLTAKGKRQVAEWVKMRMAEIAEAEAKKQADLAAKKQADLAAKKARRVASIKERLDILTANPDTVATVFPEPPETFTTAMGKEINTSNIRSKRHQLAHALHVSNDSDFQAAFAFYFLKSEYTSVQYDISIAERIEIKYKDIAG